MWPFLFILAAVPLIFYWSDSVSTVFPALAQYLPEKSAPAAGPRGGAQAPGTTATGTPGTLWIRSTTDAGYVAWLPSVDGQYRLAVGCRKAAPPSLQVTRVMGGDVPAQAILDFQYGKLPLNFGVYDGAGLLNAASQFGTVVLTLPAAAQQAPQPFARFEATRYDSGLMARGLQQNCR